MDLLAVERAKPVHGSECHPSRSACRSELQRGSAGTFLRYINTSKRVHSNQHAFERRVPNKPSC